jgi:AmmeMemoRadiSam system protein B
MGNAVVQTVLMPSVAGMFYPAAADALRSEVTELLGQTRHPGPVPKALIVPHAGYVYSGPVAASAYARLAPAAGTVRRVVLLAPSHRLPFRGLAVPDADVLRTPLGDVPVDTEGVAKALALPQVRVFEDAFRGEHALEVQLPFLQTVLTRFTVVPLIVGDAPGAEVAEVMRTLWGGDETLVVVSSDLSHYLDYPTARDRDAATTRAIEQLRPEAIGYEDACGRNPVTGLLQVARERHLHVDTVDLRNSGDTAGPKDRVVGYGAYVFS